MECKVSGCLKKCRNLVYNWGFRKVSIIQIIQKSDKKVIENH